MRLTAPLALCALLAVASTGFADTYWPMPGDVVTPGTSGLSLTSADGTARDGMPFGTGFQDTMHTLVSIYGHDVSIGFPQECGGGPMVSVGLPGQINLTFQDDHLAGWMLIDDSALRMANGVGVGSPVAALDAMGPVETFESGIGTEFAVGEVYGLFSEDGASVQAVWSGLTCIFR